MLHPLRHHVLIKPEKAPDRTESGLHLVEHWRPENLGEVVATATYSDTTCPDCGVRVFVPMEVKVGDTVVFPQEAGQEVSVDGDRYLIMREEDLIAVWED